MILTVGFSAGVVGLAMAKGTKTNAESFLIDTGIGEASIWSVAQRPLTKGVSSAPATQTVTGDSEKSRSRSLDDKSS